MRMACIVMTLMAMFMAAPPSQAQFGGMQTPSYTAPVLLENGENLPLSLIASMLKPRLPEWPESVDPVTSVQVLDEGLHLKDTHIITLMLYVHNKELEPTDAELLQLWEIACRQFEAELNRLAELGAEAQRQRLRREIDRLVAQSQPKDEVAKLVNELSDLRAKSAGSDDNLGEAIAEAISKQRELQLRDAGLQARREALERRIDEVIEQGPRSEAAQAVLNELEKLVDIRRQQLEVVQALRAAQKKGGSALDVAEAEAQLSSAIVELNRARQEAAGGGELRGLNDELSKLLIEVAEIDGQQKALEQMIADLRGQIGEAARASAEQTLLENRIQVLRHRQAEVDAELNDLWSALARQAPQEVKLRPLAKEKVEAAKNVAPDQP